MTESPRRVLYVHHSILQGGAEASLLCLLRRLAPAQVSAVLACPPGGLLEHPPAAGHAEWYASPSWEPHRSLNPLRLLGQYRELVSLGAFVRRLALLHGVDLIHANSWPAALAAVHGRRPLGARRPGAPGRVEPPVVWHVRDLRIPRRVTAWLLPRCSAQIAISHAVADFLRARDCPPSRLHLVHNGIDPAEFVPTRPPATVRAELGVPPGVPLIGSVAQLVAWKRHDLLLESARLLQGRTPQPRFVFVGGDPGGDAGKLAELRRRAESMGLDSCVHFTGYRTDVADLINACDVFVHAAVDEPLGRAVLEAMSLGKPIVVANAAGPAELIEGGVSGLTVAPDDAPALADGVQRFLDDPAFAVRCGTQAGLRARQEFSAGAMADRTLSVYDAIIGGDRP